MGTMEKLNIEKIVLVQGLSVGIVYIPLVVLFLVV